MLQPKNGELPEIWQYIASLNKNLSTIGEGGLVSIRLGNSKVTLGASGPPFPAMCFTYNAAPVVCNTYTIDVQNSIVHTVVKASLKPFTIMVLDKETEQTR